MTESEFEAYMVRLIPDYAQEHVKAGSMPKETADELARKDVMGLVPEGIHTRDHYINLIEDEVEKIAVGVLWFARQVRSGRPLIFVYDIEIWEPFRRRGYASRAFALLEDRARGLGASTISLHVFGNNTAAREMYRKLGFEETHVMMDKAVPDSAGEASTA